MKTTLKIGVVGVILALTSSTALQAQEEKADKTVTIEKMELQLANLGAEIAQEKVKLYQKEALLFEMKLDLMKRVKEKK